MEKSRTREIKFRGKRVDNGEWEIGYLLKSASTLIAVDSEIVDGHWKLHEVDPVTVGQYIEKRDKSGQEIYEGDVLSHWYRSGVVKFGEHITDALHFYGSYAYGFYVESKENQTALVEPEKTEVIGNIHDNPGLIEGGAYGQDK